MIQPGDLIASLGSWLQRFLLSLGLAPSLVSLGVALLPAILLPVISLMTAIPLIWLERKWVARLQDRIGPNRVGPFGVFQVFADMVKIFTKEDLIPQGADKIIFSLAPVLAMAGVIGVWAVLPFAADVYGVNLNVGALYVIAVGTFGMLAILLAGWSSNNKYALLGAYRAVAQLISYEVPMVLTLLVPVMLAGSMGLNDIVRAQGNGWFVFLAPLAAIIFMIAAQAEVGRAPFDLLEAESELVAGFNIEYSGMKFGFFYVAEFLHSFTFGALGATFFLGGWLGPGSETFPMLGVVYFLIKSFAVYFVFVWTRGTFPRIRIDQMINLSWKLLTPASLGLVALIAVVHRATQATPPLLQAVVLLGANLFVFFCALLVMRSMGRMARERSTAPRPGSGSGKTTDPGQGAVARPASASGD
ncbi:MAG: NADH-quinone oxidoreductase subunit NuoH [Anaerolineales bacterium]